MTFPCYPKYRTSGLEWLDQVPDHWSSVPIKYMALERNSLFLDGDWIESKDISSDGIRYITTGNVGEGAYKEQGAGFISEETFHALGCTEVYEGDVLVSRLNNPIGRACVVPDLGGRVVTSVDNVIFRPDSKFYKKFIVYLFSSEEYFKHTSNLARGATMQRISRGLLGNIRVVTPSLEEQTQIARFLDHETARIDALIEEQQRLIELLKEKRQAVISHAVTKGLDPTVPMKDSGVEWLGEVPVHWERKRLKNISPFITVGIVVNPSDYVAEEGLPFIYGGEVKEGLIEVDKARKISLKDSLRNRKTMLEAGDIVTMRVGYPGLTAVVPPECEGGNCASVMLVKRGGFDSRWLCAVMNSRLVRQQVEVVQYGAAQKQFNIADAIEFWMFKPPLNEQATIAEFVEEQSSIFDALTAESENSMVLLQERRSALISAAVTGKIDVRGWQPPASAPTPELVEEAV